MGLERRDLPAIIAGNDGAACSGTALFICCDLFGNVAGDGLCGNDGGGNMSVDPLFCSHDPDGTLDVSIQDRSPCAPSNATNCGLIGAGAVECKGVAVERHSWSDVKELYRR